MDNEETDMFAIATTIALIICFCIAIGNCAPRVMLRINVTTEATEK